MTWLKRLYTNLGLEWVVNLLLVIIARVGLYVLSIPLFGFGIIITSTQKFTRSKKGALAKYLYSLAVTLDVLANVLGGPVWNIIMKNAGGYEFGSRYDTISYVLGMNRQLGTLNKFGLFWCWVLEKIDPGHLEKAIRLEGKFTIETISV